jgi:cellulose synthase/poly-beta-1,6-N-acetylglucosamine synthase-like glycosyltransferase
MAGVASVVFWLSALLIVLNMVGYPHALRSLGRIGISARRRNVQHRPDAPLPSVTLIVPVYNEAAHIAWKIQNCLSLQYPPDRLSIRLVSDGCTDRSFEIAKESLQSLGRPDRIVLRAFERNRGKVAVLNDEVALAESDLVALVDASAWLPEDALLALIPHFADASVGVACPAYATLDAEGAETAYWRVQTSLKKVESDLASVIGPHGACYLFRRALWTPLAPDTINDDFILPMRIVAGGHSALYDDSVVVREREASSTQMDFRRRLRIGAGNMQQIIRLANLANPARPMLALLFIFGKGLRAFVPLLALLAFLSAAYLAFCGVAPFAWVVGAAAAIIVIFVAAQTGFEPLMPRSIRLLSYVATWIIASAIGSTVLLAGFAKGLWATSNTNKRTLQS